MEADAPAPASGDGALSRPKGWGPWKGGYEGWWMRPGRGIVTWRFRAPDGREFNGEDSALEYAQSLLSKPGQCAAGKLGHADSQPAVTGTAILKSYTNTIPRKNGPPGGGKRRSGHGVCTQSGAAGHRASTAAEATHQPEKKKRARVAPSVSSSSPSPKRRAPLVADKQHPPPQPSVARSGRVRKAVARWAEDPLSSVNLGGRQELLTAVVTGAVSSEKEFHEAKLAKQREHQAMFRAEQDKVRQEEAAARREAAAMLAARRELQEAAVAEVAKGFAAKSQAGFDKARREYLQSVKSLRGDLGLAVEPVQRDADGVATSEDGMAAAAATTTSDKLSTESEWLQKMQRKCRQQAGVILMQQQQRLREQELAAAMLAAEQALGGSHDDVAMHQRIRRLHPTAKRPR